MNYYEKELKALEKVNRIRTRKLFDPSLLDLASNDYLGIGNNKKILKKAYKSLKKYKDISSKASMLVNGYHPIHQKFEKLLCKANGFANGIVVGSGFLANIALIESLVRKKDILFIDEEYHASGNLATKLLDGEVVLFKHNDPKDLQEKILHHKENKQRIIIAIEGVYSMDGTIAPKEFVMIADEFDALFIVDEAHSSGVIGENLLGWFDYHHISIKKNHIKMGTLGKAYGSYGAYILASKHIIQFLANRAKPIIYSTAPSLFDTAFAYHSLKHILKSSKKIKKYIKTLQTLTLEQTGIKTDSLILPIVINDNEKVLQLQKKLIDHGFLIGAIRQPTVQKAILRIILRTCVQPQQLQEIFTLLEFSNVQKFINLVQSGLYGKAHEVLEDDWRYFKKNGLKQQELFYKGMINGATALELIKRKRSNEAIDKTWQCFLRHEKLLSYSDKALQNSFQEAIDLLKELKKSYR